MRTLAIDLGARRIGLAISDDGARFATPHSVIDASSATSQILDLIKRESIQRLIIGLPLNMDDSLGPAAEKTIHWARQLESEAKIPLLFVDERLSSFEAEQQLVSRKRAGERLTRGKKKKQLDALAAASILQQFLDGKLQPIEL